jgi:hypothetical protein
MRRLAVLLAVAALLIAPTAALAQEPFTAQLSHDVEVPAPTVPDDYAGMGSATVTVSDDESEITYEVTFEGLTGPLTMAHIHWGASGAAGPPIFWLTDQSNMTGTPSPLSGTLAEADFVPADGGPQTYAEALAALRAGNTYVNLHTEANGPGEIRGQLVAATEPGDDEPPDTATAEQLPAGAGLPWMTLTAALLSLAALLFVSRRFMARLS